MCIRDRQGIHVGAGVSAVGVGTFGSLDISGDIDVDGHTNLDNVSIAGVTTMNSTLNIVSAQPLIYLNNTSYENDYQVQNLAGTFTVRDVDRGNNVFQIGKTGLSTFSGQLDVQGNVTLDKDLDVDGHTNLDNVSIAGVTTFSGDLNIAENIIHTGDTDTKISFPSNDTIRFDVAGSQTNYIQLDNEKTVFMRPIMVGDYVSHSGIREIGVKFFNSGTPNNIFVGLGAETNGTSGGINHKTFQVFRQGSSVTVSYTHLTLPTIYSV